MESLLDFKGWLAAFPPDFVRRGMQDGMLLCVIMYLVKTGMTFWPNRPLSYRWYGVEADKMRSEETDGRRKLVNLKARKIALNTALQVLGQELTARRAGAEAGITRRAAVVPIAPQASAAPTRAVAPPATDATFADQPALA